MRTQLWRAVVLFRILAVIYAGAVIVADRNGYAHPAAGFAVLAGLVVWTAASAFGYLRGDGGRRRVETGWLVMARGWLVMVDTAVAVAAVGLTRYVDTAAHVDHGAPTLAAAWGAAPVVAAAVAGGPWTGLAAALVVSGADVAERGSLARTTFNGAVLLVIVGVVGGYVARLVLDAERLARDAARRQAAAAGLEAATTERARLARDIHDSVLQVLALISRRGRQLSLGGEKAEGVGGAGVAELSELAALADLAAEQEAALRALVADTPPSAGAPPGTVDLRSLLSAPGPGVSVAVPAEAVLLPEPLARCLAGAAGEALANVERHAGSGARAWVLVEDDGAAVRVSVRDDGCGFSPGRLDEAARAGRLGVAESIVGRARSAGGEAVVTSTPGEGTEVEIRVPRT